ncbi:MAG: DUF6531 domain-containing protein [Gammaproteobacteria bacterium]
MHNVRFGGTLALLFAVFAAVSAMDIAQACSLQFTSPVRGSTVLSATVGVSGTGSGTANPGDLGQVTATVNGRVFFQRSGVFTNLIQFLGSGAASVTLEPGANHFTVQGSAGSCSATDSMVVYYTPPPPPEKKGSGPPRECNGSNPICGGTGNKYQREIDYVGAGVFPLRFERHYNSAWPEERTLGAQWRSHYDRQLATTATETAITRPEGQAFLFKLVGGVWTPEIDVSERLEHLTDTAGQLIGWRYTTNTDETERYDAQGRLAAITNRHGLTQTLAYYAAGRLASVTDPAGRMLRFTYDEIQRLQTMTDPAGGVYSYRYDGNGNLASVGYPDATPADPSGDPIRAYHYEDPRFASPERNHRRERRALCHLGLRCSRPGGVIGACGRCRACHLHLPSRWQYHGHRCLGSHADLSLRHPPWRTEAHLTRWRSLPQLWPASPRHHLRCQRLRRLAYRFQRPYHPVIALSSPLFYLSYLAFPHT